MTEETERQPTLEDLVRHTENLAVSSNALRGEIAASRATTRRDRKVYMTLIIVLVIGVVSTLSLALLNRVTYTTIKSCVDPKGSCYQESQKRQGDVIGDPQGPINTVAVASAACGAAHPGDVAATLKCTREALAEINKK